MEHERGVILNYALEIHDMTVAYDSKPVLWDIDLQIPTGSMAAIMGPNGAGKTTLLKGILQLLKPISGNITFPSLGEGHIAYVPQSESVDWDFPITVQEVVTMGSYARLGWLKRPSKKEKALALEKLKAVGLQEFASRQIYQLSGGQKQRVFLARALMQEADIYFMDEPFKGVDVQTEKTIVTLLKELQKQGKTIIVVHHDLQTVEEYFDWVTLINVEVVANGSVDEVFHLENLKKTYGSGSLFPMRT